MVLSRQSLSNSKLLSLTYHSIFEFPLSSAELEYWQAGGEFELKRKPEYFKARDYFYIKGQKKFVVEREKRLINSAKKEKYAKRAGEILAKIPSISFVGITGSLAMRNCKSNSDIDLLIVCKKQTLWITRLLVIFILKIKKIGMRSAGQRRQKDLICINMWIEEGDLKISERNIYTAHELVQIRPLVDKNIIFMKLLKENKWAREYWPKAYSLNIKNQIPNNKQKYLLWQRAVLLIVKIFNPVAYWGQYWYMRGKITNETISKTRAFFHPRDGSTWYLTRFNQFFKMAVDEY